MPIPNSQSYVVTPSGEVGRILAQINELPGCVVVQILTTGSDTVSRVFRLEDLKLYAGGEPISLREVFEALASAAAIIDMTATLYKGDDGTKRMLEREAARLRPFHRALVIDSNTTK